MKCFRLRAIHISRDQPRGVGGSQMIIFDHKEGGGGLENDHRIMLMDKCGRRGTI